MTKLRDWMGFGTLACLSACGSPEQTAIDQFFRAAQANDSTTLAYMSAVSPPVEAEAWKVVEVSSRSTEPFTLPKLLEEFNVAKKERDEVMEGNKKYFTDQKDALEQIIPKLREDPDYKFRGKLAEIQTEWLRLTEVRKEKEGAYQKIKATVDRESGIATKSVMRQVDLGTLAGDIAVTEMLLNVKPKEGAELPYKFTLRKYDLSAPETDRVEPARWIIVDIEGTTEEAKAAAAAHAKGGRPASEPAAVAEASAASDAKGAAASKEPARRESTYVPRELRGTARVQTLAPQTKVEGDEVVSRVSVRNASKDYITRFTVTEHWYDQQGGAVGSSSRTHQERFMPGEVIHLELRTRKNPNFYQSQYEFSHANGDVNATTLGSFPKQT